MQTLQDNFNDNSTDTGKWSSYDPGAASIAETNQRVEMTLADATAGSNYVGYYSTVSYDLTESYAYIEVPVVPSNSTNAQAYLDVEIDGNNRLGIIKEASQIYFQYTASGTPSSINIDYNSTDHRWWRIRHTGSNVLWDTSADGVNWTNRRTVATPITITALFAEFGAGTYQSETSPGAAHFDNFNIGPAGISPSASLSPSSSSSASLSPSASTSPSSSLSPSSSVSASISPSSSVSPSSSISASISPSSSRSPSSSVSASVSPSSSVSASVSPSSSISPSSSTSPSSSASSSLSPSSSISASISPSSSASSSLSPSSSFSASLSPSSSESASLSPSASASSSVSASVSPSASASASVPFIDVQTARFFTSEVDARLRTSNPTARIKGSDLTARLSTDGFISGTKSDTLIARFKTTNRKAKI